MRNNYYIGAGAICLFTALLHTIGGQLTLVDPLLASGLEQQVKTEWLGAWHMVTLLLWYFGVVLVRNGRNDRAEVKPLMTAIGQLNLLFAIAFIVIGLWTRQHAPQYILFLPVVILIYLGTKRMAFVGQ